MLVSHSTTTISPTKNCTLQNATIIKTKESTFCAAYQGLKFWSNGYFTCRDLNASLPQPRNDEEQKAFQPYFLAVEQKNLNMIFLAMQTDIKYFGPQTYKG